MRDMQNKNQSRCGVKIKLRDHYWVLFSECYSCSRLQQRLLSTLRQRERVRNLRMKTWERSGEGRNGWSSQPAPRSLSPPRWFDKRLGWSDGLRWGCGYQLLWNGNKEERVSMKNRQGGTDDTHVHMFVLVSVGEWREAKWRKCVAAHTHALALDP